MSLAVKGYGTLLKVGDGGGPEVFTAIAEVKNIGKFGAKRKLVDVTHYQSPNAFMEYILGLKDGNEFSVLMNFIPSQATQGTTGNGVLAKFAAGTVANYQIVFPTSPLYTASYAALCLEFDIDSPVDGAIVLTAGYKLTGDIAFA